MSGCLAEGLLTASKIKVLISLHASAQLTVEDLPLLTDVGVLLLENKLLVNKPALHVCVGAVIERNGVFWCIVIELQEWALMGANLRLQ